MAIKPTTLLANGFGAVNVRTGEIVILDEGSGKVYGIQDVTVSPTVVTDLMLEGENPIAWALGTIPAPGTCAAYRWRQETDGEVFDIGDFATYARTEFWCELDEKLDPDKGWYFC